MQREKMCQDLFPFRYIFFSLLSSPPNFIRDESTSGVREGKRGEKSVRSLLMSLLWCLWRQIKSNAIMLSSLVSKHRISQRGENFLTRQHSSLVMTIISCCDGCTTFTRHDTRGEECCKCTHMTRHITTEKTTHSQMYKCTSWWRRTRKKKANAKKLKYSFATSQRYFRRDNEFEVHSTFETTQITIVCVRKERLDSKQTSREIEDDSKQKDSTT